MTLVKLAILYTTPISTPWTHQSTWPFSVGILQITFLRFRLPESGACVLTRYICTEASSRSLEGSQPREVAATFSCWSGVSYLCSKNKRQRTASNLSAVTEGAIKTFPLGADVGPVEILGNRVDDQMANRLVPTISSTRSHFGHKVP